MNKCLGFIQITIAVFVGSLANDLFQQFSRQCIAKDSSGCAETRLECIWNSRKTPFIMHSCLTETKL